MHAGFMACGCSVVLQMRQPALVSVASGASDDGILLEIRRAPDDLYHDLRIFQSVFQWGPGSLTRNDTPMKVHQFIAEGLGVVGRIFGLEETCLIHATAGDRGRCVAQEGRERGSVWQWIRCHRTR